MSERNSRPRVVITGLGAISPLGSSVQLLWEGWMAGRSGVRRITQFDASDMPCQIAGEIPDFNPLDYIDRKEARRLPRSAQIAVAAAVQAVADAELPETMPDGERSGVVYGTTNGGVHRIDEGDRFRAPVANRRARRPHRGVHCQGAGLGDGAQAGKVPCRDGLFGLLEISVDGSEPAWV